MRKPVRLFILTGVLVALTSMSAAQPSRAADEAPPQSQPQPLQATAMRDDSGSFVVGPDTERQVAATRLLDNRAEHAGASCAVPPPALLTPVQDATSNDLQNPRFTWSAVPGAQDYVFQISQTSGFTAPLATEGANSFWITDTVVIHWSFEDLRTSRTYYWRVASGCADGGIGAFSAPASFTTGLGSQQPCTLPAPELIAPAAGAVITTLLPVRVFRTVLGGNEYHIETSTSPDFVNLVSFATVTRIRVIPERQPTVDTAVFENLEPNKVYYWRAKTACADIDAYGPPSTPITFTTGNATDLPPPPQLVSPVDNAATGSIRVILSYSAVPTATSYEVKTEARFGFFFSSPSLSVITLHNPSTRVSWKARARNQTGWGPWSSSRVFTTPVDRFTADITPGGGGSIAPSGALTLIFPPGAVGANTSISYTLLGTPTRLAAGLNFANRAFTLDATSNGAPVTRFLSPYTLTLRYDPTDLVIAGITDTAKPNLYFWDTASGQWQGVLPCAGCTVNDTTHTLTAVLDHFTEFMLAAPGQPTTRRIYLPEVRR